MVPLRDPRHDEYDQDNINLKPKRIIRDNEAAISTDKYNKDTTGNRHVARRYNFMQQCTSLQEHIFESIGTIYNMVIRNKNKIK